MKTTFNDLLEEYPISPEALAVSMGCTRQWLYTVINRKPSKRPEFMRKHYLVIQNHLQLTGNQMLRLPEDTELTEKFMTNFPLSRTAFSIYMGESRFWLSELLTSGNIPPDTKSRILSEMRQFGSILHDIVLLDFYDHDEVAQYLVGRNTVFGLVTK